MLLFNKNKNMVTLNDTMLIRIPDSSPTVILLMTIYLLRWFSYDDLPTTIANLTSPNLTKPSLT